MTVTKRILLSFPKSETEKPIVWRLVKDYNLQINIFRAKVTPDEYGYLVLDVSGAEQDITRGMEWVRTFDVTVNDTSVGVTWDAERCTHCGNCLTHCPTHALRVVDTRTRAVAFHPGDCVECLACLANCPFGACASLF
jgi:L-aspartate semialdehyde sulfurtransferase ferredoxin